MSPDKWLPITKAMGLEGLSAGETEESGPEAMPGAWISEKLGCGAWLTTSQWSTCRPRSRICSLSVIGKWQTSDR
jgi:hypothetical protein